MNKQILKGKWHQMKGDAKKKWGKLSDDDLDKVQGENEKLVGVVQEKYGKSREEAKREVDDWLDEQSPKYK